MIMQPIPCILMIKIQKLNSAKGIEITEFSNAFDYIEFLNLNTL
jgi:hypothetical protein